MTTALNSAAVKPFTMKSSSVNCQRQLATNSEFKRWAASRSGALGASETYALAFHSLVGQYPVEGKCRKCPVELGDDTATTLSRCKQVPQIGRSEAFSVWAPKSAMYVGTSQLRLVLGCRAILILDALKTKTVNLNQFVSSVLTVRLRRLYLIQRSLGTDSRRPKKQSKQTPPLYGSYHQRRVAGVPALVTANSTR
jgi:hypothetical protein